MSTALVTAVAGEVVPLSQLEEAASEYAQAGQTPNTRRAFEGALRGFMSWCASAGVVASPANVESVRLYLAARAPQLAASTLALHLVALDAECRAKEWPEPGRNPQVKELMKGIRNQLGEPPNKKRGLSGAEVKRIVELLPRTLTGLRDRAILLVIYAGALRRSELAALAIDTGNVRAVFVAEGLEIHVRRAKGDQEGKGAILAIPFFREACPVMALRDWIAAAGITSGPIFRPIDRHGRLGVRQLTDRWVATIVKDGAESIGIDRKLISGHSPRRGAITDMHRRGANDVDLQRHARHSDFKTTRGYIADADRFSSSAARMLDL